VGRGTIFSFAISRGGLFSPPAPALSRVYDSWGVTVGVVAANNRCWVCSSGSPATVIAFSVAFRVGLVLAGTSVVGDEQVQRSGFCCWGLPGIPGPNPMIRTHHGHCSVRWWFCWCPCRDFTVRVRRDYHLIGSAISARKRSVHPRTDHTLSEDSQAGWFRGPRKKSRFRSVAWRHY